MDIYVHIPLHSRITASVVACAGEITESFSFIGRKT